MSVLTDDICYHELMWIILKAWNVGDAAPYEWLMIVYCLLRDYDLFLEVQAFKSHWVQVHRGPVQAI